MVVVATVMRRLSCWSPDKSGSCGSGTICVIERVARLTTCTLTESFAWLPVRFTHTRASMPSGDTTREGEEIDTCEFGRSGDSALADMRSNSCAKLYDRSICPVPAFLRWQDGVGACEWTDGVEICEWTDGVEVCEWTCASMCVWRGGGGLALSFNNTR